MFILSKEAYYTDPLNLSNSKRCGQVIKSTFRPFTSRTSPLPTQLVPELLARFSSSEAYRLYPDVSPFFQALHERRHPQTAIEEGGHWPWDLTVVGVITNSDDRVPSILSSLGLKVGARMVQKPEQMSQGNTQFQAVRNEDAANAIPMGSFSPRCFDGPTRTDEDINFTVLSYDVGAEKPNPQIFQAAKDMLRLTLQDDRALSRRDKCTTAPGVKESTDSFAFLHIGDDVQKDVIGAQKAGFQSILLDREGTYSQAFEESKKKILSVPLSDTGARTSHEMQVIQDLRDLRYWPIQR
jgi:HAD-hyrolase-like